MLISIHAPLRERLTAPRLGGDECRFQSTLPCGSDAVIFTSTKHFDISIHAPLRERPIAARKAKTLEPFQSTLPCGSDALYAKLSQCHHNFNPRSLAGATRYSVYYFAHAGISIHAPLRERHLKTKKTSNITPFQSTLPCGSDTQNLRGSHG